MNLILEIDSYGIFLMISFSVYCKTKLKNKRLMRNEKRKKGEYYQ